MEGRVVEINVEKEYGRIDTQNREIGRLTFYLNKIFEEIKINDTVSFEVKKSKAGNLYAKNVKLVHRNLAKFNTEDKQTWCKEGEKLEKAFVEEIVPKLGLDIGINPQKRADPYVIDLIDRTNNRFADLKSQNTPFFSSGRYVYPKNGQNYDPAYTMTFNKKDYERYKVLYPDCDIYVCINWTQLEYGDKKVNFVNGVWRAHFYAMAQAIENGDVILHEYIHRKNDDKNAKSSYLFDLRDEEIFERVIEN